MDIHLQSLIRYGFHFHPDAQLAQANSPEWLQYAMDAAGPLLTSANTGIPDLLTTYVDPQVVDILLAPMAATRIFDEVQKGDMSTLTTVFMTVEQTGNTSPYGDFNGSGRSDGNINFPQRQNYGFQTIIEYGDKQLKMAGAARVNYASLMQTSAANTLARKANDVYLYGVAGLQNYGILNDPDLPTPTTPTTGTGGNTWALKISDEIYADWTKIFNLLVSQTKGLIDRNSRLKAVMDPLTEANLTKQNQYGQVLYDRIKLAFPNLEIVTVPQYATLTGNLFQLIAPALDGVPTGQMAYAEKQRSHGVVRELSAFKEKKSGHAWGTVLFRPFAVAQMLGV